MKLCVATMVGPGSNPHQAWDSVREMVDGVVDTAPGVITDFSAARNELLAQAAFLEYDWALMLDTDETLRYAGPDAIRVTLAITDDDVVMVPYIDGTYGKERFFRLPARGHYEGPTHEAFILEEGARRGTVEDPLFCCFSEAPKTAEQYQAKALRDLDILEEYTVEHPSDARWWYYLGDTRTGLGLTIKARTAFETCFYCNGWDEEGAWAAYRIATLYAEEEFHDVAIAWCTRGMTRRADFPELPWLAGWCSYQLGRYEQAIAWAEMAVRHPGDYGIPRIIFRHPPAHHEAPYDVLRWAYRKLGHAEPAAFYDEEFERAKAIREKSRAP